MILKNKIAIVGLAGLILGQAEGMERLKKVENVKRKPTEMSHVVAQHCIKRGTLETIDGDTYYIAILHGDWMARFYDDNHNKKLDANEKIEYFNPWDVHRKTYVDIGGNGIGPEDVLGIIQNGSLRYWSLKADPEVKKLTNELYHAALKPLFDFENTA